MPVTNLQENCTSFLYVCHPHQLCFVIIRKGKKLPATVSCAVRSIIDPVISGIGQRMKWTGDEVAREWGGLRMGWPDDGWSEGKLC